MEDYEVVVALVEIYVLDCHVFELNNVVLIQKIVQNELKRFIFILISLKTSKSHFILIIQNYLYNLILSSGVIVRYKFYRLDELNTLRHYSMTRILVV